MSYADDLLADARRLASHHGPGRPRHSSLDRAISTTYYAVFHELSDTAVSRISGSDAERVISRRMMQHTEMRSVCAKFTDELRGNWRVPDSTTMSQKVPDEIVQIAALFIELQNLRHDADYDRRTTPRRRLF